MAVKHGHVKISAPIQSGPLRKKLLALMSNTETMREVHERLKDFVEPFVPFGKTGELRENAVAQPKGVLYRAPYAHYQFEGDVYGPNLPVLGPDGPSWISRKPKHPMGRKLGENNGFAELQLAYKWDGGRWKKAKRGETASFKFGYTTPGTHYQWLDEAMKNGGKRRFSRQATEVMKRRAKRLNKI